MIYNVQWYIHVLFPCIGMRAPPYWANYSAPRLVIHTVCSSKYFDLAIAGVIGLNVITMAMEFYMMPEVSETMLKVMLDSGREIMRVIKLDQPHTHEITMDPYS